jgi:hypothetical protein
MFPRNILTILKVSSFLCLLATKMVYATNGTHLRHVREADTFVEPDTFVSPTYIPVKSMSIALKVIMSVAV